DVLVAGGREADARARTLAADGRVVRLDLIIEAEDLALRVEQRPAGVARVDRGVGLDRAGDRVLVRGLDAAADGADDALGGRLGQAERAADRDDRIADLGRRGVGEGDRVQLRGG